MNTTILDHPAIPSPAPVTHEAFIHAVRAIVLPRVTDDTKRAHLAESKLVYGAGHGMGARGVTFFGAWANGTPDHDFLEVCAAGEETTVQIAGPRFTSWVMRSPETRPDTAPRGRPRARCSISSMPRPPGSPTRRNTSPRTCGPPWTLCRYPTTGARGN